MNENNVSFYYDEDFGCLVKLVDDCKETRMSLDGNDLNELQYFLEQYLFTDKKLVDFNKTTKIT